MIDLMGENWQQGMETVLSDSEKIGVRFELCHLPFGVKIGGTEEEVAPFNASVHRAIDAAKILGVDFAVLHPNTTTVPRLQFDKQAQYDDVMAHLAPFAEHAAKVGLNIVVENMRPVPQIYPFHRYCSEPEELCAIADALGIGICWDFGHAHIAGLRQSEALNYVGSRLRMLHVNDNFTWGDDHVAPFMGTIDWADAMKGLSNVGFEGLLNFELSATRIPACARESFAHYVIDVSEQLCAMIED
jgi:sugar phosphate isomerase/epimerase